MRTKTRRWSYTPTRSLTVHRASGASSTSRTSAIPKLSPTTVCLLLTTTTTSRPGSSCAELVSNRSTSRGSISDLPVSSIKHGMTKESGLGYLKPLPPARGRLLPFSQIPASRRRRPPNAGDLPGSSHGADLHERWERRRLDRAPLDRADSSESSPSRRAVVKAILVFLADAPDAKDKVEQLKWR